MSDPRPVAPALSKSLASAPDDFDHPHHEVLVALVDGRLDGADVEWVQSHLDLCPMCATDVADLVGMQAALQANAAPASRTWSIRTLGAIAASLTLIVSAAWWMNQREPAPAARSAEVASAVTPPTAAAVAKAVTPEEEAAVARALATRRVEWPAQMTVLQGRAGTLLGTQENTGVLRPTGPMGTAVRTTRPQFVWTPLTDATSYTVAVFNSRFELVADSGPVTGTRWTPSRDLPRDQVLAWQITAHRAAGDVVSPAPPQPEARFLVLSSEAAAAVEAAQLRLADEPLALAVVLAKAGLVEEARAALTRALTDPRYDPAAVQALLRSFS